MMKLWNRIQTGFLGASLLALSSGGCGKALPGGTMSVSFPDPQTLQFSAVLSQSSSFSLNGDILIPPDGDIYFLPADATHGFTFGGRLNLKAFLPSSWQFAEVTQLPTGVFFPPFVQTPLVQVPLSQDYLAYIGVRDQKYLGVGWSFIKSTTTPIGLGANYYDAKGNVVLGGIFYPPVVTNGQVTVPGGLFMATNLTPFVQSQKASALPVIAAEKLLTHFGDQETVLDDQTLTVKTYALEDGIIRETKRSDWKVAQLYLKELKSAEKKGAPFHFQAKN